MTSEFQNCLMDLMFHCKARNIFRDKLQTQWCMFWLSHVLAFASHYIISVTVFVIYLWRCCKLCNESLDPLHSFEIYLSLLYSKCIAFVLYAGLWYLLHVYDSCLVILLLIPASYSVLTLSGKYGTVFLPVTLSVNEEQRRLQE